MKEVFNLIIVDESGSMSHMVRIGSSRHNNFRPEKSRGRLLKPSLRLVLAVSLQSRF